MAKRSTRQKIRDSAKKAVEDTERCMMHLQYLDELADGQSKYITENLPTVVYMVDEVRKLLVNFRSGL